KIPSRGSSDIALDRRLWNRYVVTSLSYRARWANCTDAIEGAGSLSQYLRTWLLWLGASGYTRVASFHVHAQGACPKSRNFLPNAALWATTNSNSSSKKGNNASSIDGASLTSSSVMWCIAEATAGIGMPGLTKDW